MRVGLVIYGSLDTLSGGYLFDRNLVRYLQDAGDIVDVISIPWRNYAAHLLDNVSYDLYRQLRAARVDVLLQDELNHPSLFSINQRLRGNVAYPILAIVHHLRCYETHPAWIKFFYRAIEHTYLASVDGFIFNSRTTRDAVGNVLGHTPSNSVVAFPAGNRFNPQIDSARIIARAHEPGALRIVFVGNLIARKGLHWLIDALARLPADLCQLTVVGNPTVDAKYTAMIRKQIAAYRLTHVRLVGAIQDDALANVLTQSQVLVVPSDYEGFGIVYLEAMSFGLAAIATTAGAASEIITDGVDGFLVAPNDATMLAHRLDELHHKRDLLASLGLAARGRFVAHPTWDESMARVHYKLIEMMR